jgi:hypothetical protein
MQIWRVIVLGLMIASTAQAAEDRVPLKDENGKTLGVFLFCNECEKPAAEPGKRCLQGAVDGWLDGKPCGSCLVKSNWGVLVRYPRDLVVNGKLVREDGTPAKNHYVKLFTSNGWGARTQANPDGSFKMRLGATAERDKGKAIEIDIGERVDRSHDGKDQFSFYLMPEVFVDCGAEAKP